MLTAMSQLHACIAYSVKFILTTGWKAQNNTLLSLCSQLGDVLWMETLRIFLVNYVKELSRKYNKIICVKASDSIYNQGQERSITEDHKNLLELFYHVICASIINWEAIEDIKCLLMLSGWITAMMCCQWPLFGTYLKNPYQWRGWVYRQYLIQPTLTNMSLLKYTPKEYKG